MEAPMVLLASDFDRSRFLKAGDLSSEKKFRIKSVSVEEIGTDKKERKPVLWFTNDERGLVLNLTNLRTLSGAFGDNMETWAGRIIVIFPTMVDMRGKMVAALRVRIPPPKQASGNGQTVSAPKPAPVIQASNDFVDEVERSSAKPAARPNLTDEMDDEIPF
jgi:hypothetical protein